MNFADRVAIVTGCGQGIGKAVCLELAESGCKVAAADINEKSAKKIAKTISDSGGEAIATKVNVAAKDQVQNMVAVTLKKFGKVDILINNAGIARDSLLENMTEDDWDEVMNVNLKGVFLCIQAVAPEMRRNKYGRVINISSKGGVAGGIGQTNYSAAKTGIIGLTRSVAKEFGRYANKEGADMTCNAILPGFIDTPLSKKIPQEIKEKYLQDIPLNRLGKPQDIAKAVRFLASSSAGYITGTTIGADGGFFMGVGC